MRNCAVPNAEAFYLASSITIRKLKMLKKILYICALASMISFVNVDDQVLSCGKCGDRGDRNLVCCGGEDHDHDHDHDEKIV